MIDIANDEQGLAELLAIGPKTVPVVAAGREWVAGVNLTAVADLLGLSHDDTPRLGPDQLVERLDLVVGTAIRLTRQIPPPHLADKLPNRPRSHLALANHIIEIAKGFVEVTGGARLSGTRAAAVPDTDLDVEALAERADMIRSDLTRWWNRTDDERCNRRVDTFTGEQTLHQVLERATWHGAQHVRQLAMVVEALGITPDRPLAAKDLEGLPVPRKVWDG